MFVGRGPELAQLAAAGQDSAVTAVLVSGEAGIGKSRLVSEFVSRLGGRPLVLTGRCLEFGNDGPALAPFRAPLRALSCEQENPGFGTVLTLLEEAAETRPLVLVLEDLHWADGSSLRLISFLIANLAHPGVLLIGTHRPPTGPLRRLTAELSRVPAVRRLALAPLTRYEVGRQLAALLTREPAPALIARVADRSAGNPLFVEALATAPDETPAELLDLLHAGLPELDGDPRHVLAVASVAGTEVPHDLLEAVAGLPADRLDRAVEQLIGAHVLTVTDRGYAFRHALVRLAVYERLLPARRARLHLQFADALPACAGREAEVAAHAYAAGDRPRALASAWRAAGQAAAIGAEPERLHLAERVLELWEPSSGIDRLAVLDHALEAGYASGAVERGLRWADEAVAEAPTARRHYWRARLRNLHGLGGGDDLRMALTLDPDERLRAAILVEVAGIDAFTGVVSDAAQEAADLAERVGDPAVAAQAYAYLGLATGSAEHFARARAVADPDSLPAIATWEAALHVGMGRYTSAIDAVRAGIGVAHATYSYAKHGPILAVKWVQALAALGRRDEALSRIDETLTDPGLPPLSHAALLISRGEINLATGDQAAASSAASTAADLLGDSPWAASYLIRLRTLQARLAPSEAPALLAAVPDFAAHPHEAWPLVALATRASAASSSVAPSSTAPRLAAPLSTALSPAAHSPTTPPTATPADAGAAVSTAAWAVSELPVVGPVDAAYRAVALGDWDAAADLWRELGRPEGLAGDLRRAHSGRLPARRPAPTAGLTTREQEVLRLVAEGRTNRQIAAELFISVNTAGVHVSRILAKLGVATRTEAARKLLTTAVSD